MKTLYICHTIYHLLITLCKVQEEDPSDLVLFDQIPGRGAVISRLRKTGLFENVVELSETDISFHQLHLVEYHDIMIFNDWTTIGEYLRDSGIYYRLLEDGYDYYKYDIYRRHFSWKKRLYHCLSKKERPLGYSKYVKTIEVNNLSRVTKDFRYSKMREVPRKFLFSTLSPEKISTIKKVFGFQPISTSRRALLLLTQPLYQDKSDYNIATEQEQLEFYKKIIERYHEEYHIYLKIHPRDSVDYRELSISFQITFMRREVPMEVYELYQDIQFNLGVAHSSTVLDYLTCVKKKIILLDF